MALAWCAARVWYRLRTSRMRARQLAWRAFVVLCVGALSALVRAGTPTSVVSVRQGQTIEIRANAALQADAATAWHVITDYERYADFIPDLASSRIVERDGARVVVEQRGDAWIGPVRLPMHERFEIRETAPLHIESRATAGTLHSLASRWTITPAGSGSRLDYVGVVEPGYAFAGPLEQYLVERNIARQFDALVTRIERCGALAKAARR